MLDKNNYRRLPRHHKVNINIRLRCISPGRKPTRADVIEVLQEILDDNRVRVGWQVAIVDWGNPKGGSTNWRSGDVSDLREFHAVINHEIEQHRVGIIRNGEDI